MDTKRLLIAGLAGLAALTMSAAQPAFPGAEGFGRNAQGGRGGDVYYVTNLNDSGAGSFREGIESASGPRTVVFALSGTIALKSALFINKPNLTIAGQTAPGDGITLRDSSLKIGADDVIVRYIRSRLGDMGGSAGDAISIGGTAKNVMVDHCSASWSIDETFSALSKGNLDLVTIQWCIISEGLNSTIHPKDPGEPSHSKGGILGARQLTVHHNLYAHHDDRNPKISWRLYIQADFRNNVIYDWGRMSCHDGAFAHANWVNNYYKPGPSTHPAVKHLIFRIENREPMRDPALCGDARAQFFVEGNYVDGFPEISANNWAGGVQFAGEPGFNEANTRVRVPFDFPRLSDETSAQKAYELVLASAGASLARDAVDERIVHEVRTGTVSGISQTGTDGAAKGPHGIIVSQREVGGWPTLRSAEPPADSDRDGMPDWWETAHKLAPNNPADRNLDRDGDGYTNLEEYLNWLAKPDGHFLDKHPTGAARK